jgi:hypothetical protein
MSLNTVRKNWKNDAELKSMNENQTTKKMANLCRTSAEFYTNMIRKFGVQARGNFP